MNSREEIHQYWQNPPSGNLPNTYIKTLDNRSGYLVELIKRYGISSDRILEIGCNVGRNLEFLFKSNFQNLNAIEINSKAILLLKETFPIMADNLQIFFGSVEEQILFLQDNSFDITFTMAVFQHIHPDSNFIFPHVTRITKKYLITVENEGSIGPTHFPRNYQKIFESLEMKQIYEEEWIKILGKGYWLRIFKKKNVE